MLALAIITSPALNSILITAILYIRIHTSGSPQTAHQGHMIITGLIYMSQQPHQMTDN